MKLKFSITIENVAFSQKMLTIQHKLCCFFVIIHHIDSNFCLKILIFLSHYFELEPKILSFSSWFSFLSHNFDFWSQIFEFLFRTLKFSRNFDYFSPNFDFISEFCFLFLSQNLTFCHNSDFVPQNFNFFCLKVSNFCLKIWLFVSKYCPKLDYWCHTSDFLLIFDYFLG